MSTDYFPPTPPHDSANDEPQPVKMATLSPNRAPNSTAGAKEAPNRVALKLSHLPSRQKIKPVYPRSPSTVRRPVFIQVCMYIVLTIVVRLTPTTRHGRPTVATTSALPFLPCMDPSR